MMTIDPNEILDEIYDELHQAAGELSNYAPGYHILRGGQHISGPHGKAHDAWAHLHSIVPSSVEHACAHRGYSIVHVEQMASSLDCYCPNHPWVKPASQDTHLCGTCLLG